ncbi:MAG: PorT family protein [Chitinophagaceae bacterium]|jgi:hypothetical protein|nr:PorT family protein [Chitinophagaceae bacterium]
MDDKFYDNDFERFLQQQVKQHRMYPSDAVWKGIYKQVHGNRKWPGLYFFAILTIAALTVVTVMMETGPVDQTVQGKIKSVPVVNNLDPAQVTRQVINTINSKQQNGIPGSIVASIGTANNIINPVDQTIETGSLSEQTVTEQQIVVTGMRNAGEENNPVTIRSTQAADTDKSDAQVAASTKPVAALTPAAVAANKADKAETDEEAITKKNTNPTDEYLEANPEEIARIQKQPVRVKPSKWQFQFYITPSMSYRQIVDKKPVNNNYNGPVTAYGVQANKVIRYRPGMGTEFGLGAQYKLTDRMKLSGAFQFNIRQYNIDAYMGNSELATIAVERGTAYNAIVRYRSSGGYGEAELLNKYHQVSLPLGVEYSIVNSKRFGVNVAAAVQPTYTFSQSTYLLTSDYKSYADGTEFLRRWNINSNLEATISYNTGNLQWKFGPQLRYQHLPNYTAPYPIREYLIDYGFKIGFTKTIQ